VTADPSAAVPQDEADDGPLLRDPPPPPGYVDPLEGSEALEHLSSPGAHPRGT
jgi:hypothetical protein